MLKTRLLNPSWFSPRRELSRTLVLRILANIHGAQLLIQQPNTPDELVGNPKATKQIKIQIKDPCVFERVLTGGSIALAETYIEGLWKTDSLNSLLTLLSYHQLRIDHLESKISILTDVASRLRSKLKNKRKINPPRNILAHYNLDEEFYRLLLGKHMQYSCALFDHLPTEQPEISLEQAQLQKMERICQQLQLCGSDQLLEIGSGWGSLAIYAATHYGCRITTITSSDEQYQYCCGQVHRLKLGQQIQVLSRDFRDISGHFDKVVAVEMIETVGEHEQEHFIEICKRRLKPGGLMLLQTSTLADHRYDNHHQSADFIQQLVSPGAFLPASLMLKSYFVKHHLEIIDELDLRLNYALTLRAWHNQLEANREKHPEKMDFSHHFFRIWRFYLAFSEAEYISGNNGAWQYTLRYNPAPKGASHTRLAFRSVNKKLSRLASED